jgi:hypothetical protein
MTDQTSRWRGATVALVAAFALPASATPGNGIRLGGSEGRLHPFLELEPRWDSNAFFVGDDPRSGVVLHVRPGFTLTAPGEKLAVDLDAKLDWQQWLSGEDTSDLNRLFADASLGLGVNRGGHLGLEVTDAFARSTSTSSLTFSTAVVSNRNTLGVAVPWRPGGGALGVTASGTWKLEAFEPYSSCNPGDPPNASCNEQELADLGYNDFLAGLELKWRFLPRTALLLEPTYEKRIPNDDTSSQVVSGWRAWAGLQGLVTPHIAATLKGGWGSASGGGTLSTWLANAEVEWLPTVTTSASLGYLHDWGTDPGNPFALYTIQRFYLSGKMLLAGRWQAAMLAQIELIDLQSSQGTTATLRIEPTVDYAVARWLTAGLGYAYSSRGQADIPNLPTGFAYEYTKHELWLKVRATY